MFYICMKRKIRLTESDLHRIVNESVKRILNESGMDEGLLDFFKKKKKKRSIVDVVKNDKNRNNPFMDAEKEYWREHTKFYPPRGWDRYTDKKGNFDFEKWWSKDK